MSFGALLMRSHKLLKILFASSICSSAAAEQANVHAPRPAVISVKGQGEFSPKPDYAVLNVGVVTTGKTLEEAAKSHEERYARAR